MQNMFIMIMYIILHLSPTDHKDSAASNHTVREAACTCIAELGSKVSGVSLRPHVPHLTSTLLDCFKDDSWPVRDGECTCTCVVGV